MRVLHLSEQERAYRRTTNRLGAALLLLVGLHLGLDMLLSPLLDHFSPFWGSTQATLAREFTDMAIRVLSFLLPALFYRLITPTFERSPLLLEPKLPRRTALIVPACLAIIYCAAITNGFLIRLLGLSANSPSYQAPDASMAPWAAVLAFIGTAVIPAFCEEFLFRGLVLSQLLPYGKTTAVLGSALLFGLVHQNFGQFFYATIAGVVLALAVMESGSIWVGVIIHLLNNLISVIGEVFYNRLPYASEMVLSRAIEVLVVGAGLICLIVLLHRRSEKKEPGPEALRCGAALKGGTVRSFCTPMMLAFCLLCAFEMLVLAAGAWLTRLDWGMLL